MSASAHLIALVQSYGYPAVFIGAMFEGELIIVIASLFVHGGYLSIPILFPVIMAGAMTGDGSWFLVGRYRGQIILQHFPRFKGWVEKQTKFIQKRTIVIAFLGRFMYGFRHVIPFSLGLSDIKAWRFFTADALGAFVWVTIVGSIGYFFANALEFFVGNLKRHEFGIVVGVVLGILVIHVLAQISRSLLKNFLKENSF